MWVFSFEESVMKFNGRDVWALRELADGSYFKMLYEIVAEPDNLFMLGDEVHQKNGSLADDNYLTYAVTESGELHAWSHQISPGKMKCVTAFVDEILQAQGRPIVLFKDVMEGATVMLLDRHPEHSNHFQEDKEVIVQHNSGNCRGFVPVPEGWGDTIGPAFVVYDIFSDQPCYVTAPVNIPPLKVIGPQGGDRYVEII
jgi:hypothetical protein